MSVINQKEYLKKYLKIGKAPGEKRKRKKKDKHTINRLKVIDDNIDVVVLNELNDSNNVNEEDPQIVEIIDDRPPSLRIDEKTNSKLWKPIGEAHVERKIKSEPNSDSEHSTLTPKLEKSAKASRKKRLNSDHDISPLRKEKRNNKTSDTDNSPPRKYRGNDKDDDNSPPRRSKKTGTKNAGVHSSRKSSRWDDHDTSVGLFTKELKENVTKTLDGKKAGLQNAADLVTETIKLKQKEHEVFARMADDVSGKNAATVVRRRRRKNQEEDLDEGEIAHKHELEQQNNEKYDRWGRGLKQVENYRERMIQDLHEMSKPLARYADDEDLERHLKEQERDGDPMLAYIRSKKHKEDVQAGLQVKPTYQGSFMPNRYGIAPGYRWDGVDRSNGYDKKWVDAQNARTADQEENYKWSTEDM